jgi:hypothetical protein
MSTGLARNDRVRQDVRDISSADQLLRYALAGQLERLQRPGFSQGKIAQGAGLGSNDRNAGAVLTRALRDGPTARQLRGLDEIIGTLDPNLQGGGGLSSLALRLSAERRDKINSGHLAVRVPPSWTMRILAEPPADEIGVLVQASALLSEFMAAGQMGLFEVGSIRDRHEKDLELLVRRLILIGVSPPTATNYDAQVLLGMLASYAFEPLRDRLDAQLRRSPMSFRVWRAVTQLVKLSTHTEQKRSIRSDHSAALKDWVQRLVSDSQELRKDSLYPGMSLDLELAISIPPAWSPPGDDWVHDALLARATDPSATIRERGTAAMGLWERAITENQPSREKAAENELRQLIEDFRNPETRPDAAAGLRWVAATLEHVVDQRAPVCNEWPDIDEPWFHHVGEAANKLDHAGIPDHLRDGTKSLFRHMILQNASVHCREAIETVVTSGWSAPIAQALGYLLRNEQQEAWLRTRVEFALSSLQRRDATVESDLSKACVHAWENLQFDQIHAGDAPPRSRVSEMHASLFAVGDCFGIAEDRERARAVRERLRPILTQLASAEGAPARMLRRPARAAAYLLTVTAQLSYDGKPDLSQELLEKLSQHPDRITAKLCQWVLSFRFVDDGSIRPLLSAADRGQPDDIP